MLKIVYAGAVGGLTTFNTVAAELPNIPPDQIPHLIAMASSWLERQCDRIFGKATYEETLPGSGRNRLLLSRPPIISVEEVLEQGNAITDYVIEDAEAGILYREKGWLWEPTQTWLIVPHPLAGTEKLNYKITYDGGYILPSDENRNLPYDVEEACLALINLLYYARQRDQSVSSERLGDYQVSYAQILEGNLPLIVESVIKKYRLTP